MESSGNEFVLNAFGTACQARWVKARESRISTGGLDIHLACSTLEIRLERCVCVCVFLQATNLPFFASKFCNINAYFRIISQHFMIISAKYIDFRQLSRMPRNSDKIHEKLTKNILVKFQRTVTFAKSGKVTKQLRNHGTKNCNR